MHNACAKSWAKFGGKVWHTVYANMFANKKYREIRELGIPTAN
jgi:hypothetical protein